MSDLLLKYILTITAASVAETVTFPLDLTKTRLQVQGELQQKVMRRGMTKIAFDIVQNEGFFKLWKGLKPAVLRQIVYAGSRMTFYEFLRENVFKKDKNTKRYPLWKSIPTAMIAGSSAQFIASPTDLVKVRLQVEDIVTRYKGTMDAFASIVREDGIRGLWKGWVPNCQRAAIVCLGDMSTYDTAKQLILSNTSLNDTALTHSFASACSGLVSAILGTPADVMKTRMMNQPYVNGKGILYTSTSDCLLKTIKAEGLSALWKGFIPTWSRMAPWSLTFWIVFEKIRVLSGVGNF